MTKKLLLLLALTAASRWAFAQEPPRPVWMDRKPSVRGFNFKFAFYTGTGRGATRDEAREAAFGAAYIEGLRASGMTVVSGQTLSDIKKQGVNAYIEGTNGHAVTILCEEGVRLADNSYVSYVLVQMAKSANGNPYFDEVEELGDVCKKSEFEKRKAEYRQQRDLRAEEEKKQQSSFWKYHHNDYFAITLGNGMTYGKLGGLSFSGRHGRLLGVGYHVSAGMSAEYFGSSSYDDPYIHYSAGVKFYFYKYFYLGANYGVVEVENLPAVSGVNWRTEGNKVQHAPSFMAGVDFCARRFIMGVGAGLAVEPSGGVLPAWSVGLGFTF